MAYVTIPKDLSRIQSKVLFGLTKRQVICFGAAALAGVPKERIPYVLRMCDTEGIDLDAADAQDKLDAAVAKVLEAVPELRGGAGTGSTGNVARRNGGAEDALDAKIRANIMGAC